MIKYPGLTSEQVVQNRINFGSNEPEQKRAIWQQVLWDIIKEPMLLLLIAGCAIYFITGENREGWIMLVAIGIVSGISIYQQIRSENAIKELNKLTSLATTVIRSGKEIQVTSNELVKDDIIILSEGKIVPADAILLEVNDLTADESLLTGESLPLTKNVKDYIFSGSTLTSGFTTAQVVAVGSQTKIGKLRSSLLEITKEKTPLQIQISKFITKMALVGVVAFLIVWIYNYVMTKNVIESLLHGLTLAMAILPEEIPVALSTFMALGAYHMIKNNVLTRQPQTVEALGAATVICVDKTGTLTKNQMTVVGIYDFDTKDTSLLQNSTTQPTKVLLMAKLASEEEPFDPMEKAIHEKYFAVYDSETKYKKISEYPLSGIPPFMTHVFLDENNNRIIAAKGAPEAILKLCDLSNSEKEQITEQIKYFASQGMRVLGVSEGIWQQEKLPLEQEQIPMRFIGLLALNDPLRKNIPEVIKKFYQAGIAVKMITGDFSETAVSIAKMAGIHHSEKCISGEELSKLNEKQFAKTIRENNVFSRVLPEIKLKIVNALKLNGEVVAMTGDGVNDAPALKAAHIGISMGKRGSEVARQSSSLVLLDDDLGGMVKAVEFGRNIYANLKKAIQYIICIHIPLIAIVTIPLLLGWKFPNIFSPVHVIFLELIMGPTCSIAYENEPMEKGLMLKRPRKMSDSLFTWSELSRSLTQGVVLTAGLLSLFYFAIYSGYNETTTRTLVFTMLVISNIFLTLTGRSLSDPIYKTLFYKNNMIWIVISITIALLALTLSWSPAIQIFEFTKLDFIQISICIGLAVISVLWIDIVKMIRTKK